jgi:diacylglycerol kinase family enzyme
VYKIAFLINPVSGGGAGAGVFERLEEILGSFGVKRGTWTAEITETGRLEEQADNLIRSSRKLIAVGGDGTLGIVLDRVRHLRPSTVIGLIPLGTGNDLGRALGVYRVYDAKGLIACLKRLLRAPSLPFDLWDAGHGGATVVSYLSAGMDAAVLRDFDQARRCGALRGGALGNKLFYMRALFARAGHRFPAGARARLDTDQGLVEVALEGQRALLAANINSYAAGARPVPGNRFDDGLLEVVVFDTLWRYLLVVTASRILPAAARWIRPPRWRARKVELFLPPETPVQIDGEDFTGRFPDSPLTIRFAARVRLLDLRRSFYALF